MTPEQLAEIKRNWHSWPVTDLIAEVERLQAENAQLDAIRRTFINAITEPDKNLRASLLQVVYESSVRYKKAIDA